MEGCPADINDPVVLASSGLLLVMGNRTVRFTSYRHYAKQNKGDRVRQWTGRYFLAAKSHTMFRYSSKHTHYGSVTAEKIDEIIARYEKRGFARKETT